MDRGFEHELPDKSAERDTIILACRLSLDGELAIHSLHEQIQAENADTALEYALGVWTSLVHKADSYGQIGFCGPHGFQRITPVPAQTQPGSEYTDTLTTVRNACVNTRIYAEFEEAAIMHGLPLSRAIESALAVAAITVDMWRQRQRLGYAEKGHFFELP